MTPAPRKRKRLMAEINVVPYIDVMLVLLIIFMITAPLLTQGVKIDLPQASSQPIPPESKDPLVLTVDSAGKYYLNVGGKEEDEPVATSEVLRRVQAIIRRDPAIPVMVRGDKAANYGQVMNGINLLKEAGVPTVGLITEPQDTVKQR